ncbi:hypothetical protein BDQ17DRAFT_1377963 [Cyathus striatus]|nr:hypothetical protein BDQ17DRAFT_1377963 [Cyathus striatus]
MSSSSSSSFFSTFSSFALVSLSSWSGVDSSSTSTSISLSGVGESCTLASAWRAAELAISYFFPFFPFFVGDSVGYL